MTKIVPNDLLNPTEKTIKNWNCAFIAVEGPNILDKLSLEDLEIPYESQYRSRIILKSNEENQPLIYGFIGKAVTFLMIKVTYDSLNDPYYKYEQEKYNIEYYFENDPIIRPLGRLLIMTGSIENRIPQIYLNNPLDYDVTLDVLHATLDTEYESDEDAPPVAEIDNSLKSVYNQPNNGFAVGIVISNSGGTWIKADASTDSKLGHIVIETILDSNRFIGVQAGLITISSWNLTPGSYYVLDDSGNGTIVEYNDGLTFPFSNPVLQAINATQAHVLPWRPSFQGTVPTVSGITEDVAVAKVGGGTRTLHFVNGVCTGYTDS